jgi:hypothetical protein
VIAILVLAPEVFPAALKLPAGGSGAAEVALVVAFTALIGLLGVGVVRRGGGCSGSCWWPSSWASCAFPRLSCLELASR